MIFGRRFMDVGHQEQVRDEMLRLRLAIPVECRIRSECVFDHFSQPLLLLLLLRPQKTSSRNPVRETRRPSTPINLFPSPVSGSSLVQLFFTSRRLSLRSHERHSLLVLALIVVFAVQSFASKTSKKPAIHIHTHRLALIFSRTSCVCRSLVSSRAVTHPPPFTETHGV